MRAAVAASLLAALLPGPASAYERCDADERWDTRVDGVLSPAGPADLLEVCVDLASELTITVRVAEPRDPADDPRWTSGDTRITADLLPAPGERTAVQHRLSVHHHGDRVSATIYERPVGISGVDRITCTTPVVLRDGAYVVGPVDASTCLGGRHASVYTVTSAYDTGSGVGTDAMPDAERALLVRDGDSLPARGIERACPSRTPPAGFRDVPADGAHRHAIDCVVWWGVARGVSAEEFRPTVLVSRAQMATYIAAVLEVGGYDLPQRPEDAFDDDDGTVHELAINQLAAVGVVGGTAHRTYSPGRPVSRAQMAAFLSSAYATITGGELPADADHFHDDAGHAHEDAVDRVGQTGLAAGLAGARYGPDQAVRRDQMATFLARLLDVLVEELRATPPG